MTRIAAAVAVVSAAFLSLATAPTPGVQDISSLLLQQTQAFSDAGHQGDAAVMDKLLDSTVVFFNENGDMATKQDLVSSAAPSPKGMNMTLTVTDWHCQVHGDVAVASFIDVQGGDYKGQPLHAKFRSVETWRKEGAQWRMIASETIALSDDPPAVILPTETLDEYVGTYAAAPDVKFIFTRSGKDLMASTDGSPPTAQQAELRDVFFTPGRARYRKIFQRDAHGTVTGFISRHEGHDIVFKRVS
jgi:ketosteroid isomerase-like protein